MMNIRKNDKVKVLTGRDKGKEGVVLRVSPRDEKVLVQGISLVTHHVKARRQGETSGIKKQEGFIALSNVMPICPACKSPCRTNVKDLENKRARVCNKCKEIF